MAHRPGREDYTVGWICALPLELVAARAMLDKRYEAPDLEAGEKWEDTYYLGSIAGHNVVIACLPWRTGTTPAAALATRMQAKFQKIRLRFMVGIGGGVPSQQADIRLGDVVVSVPQHTFGGVVQYDMGKTTPTDVIRTGSLSPPPQALLSAAVALQSDILMGESKLLQILSETEHILCLRRCESSDVLYDAKYNHENGPTCKKCHSGKRVVRPQRMNGQEVMVHHGTIASGNQVIKSAAARDKISQKLGGVLCFEMEAAGLMNDFQCIVIRGISDYADSHKNDGWQGYAARTAAAYAKELLSKIPPTQVVKIPKSEETVKDMGKRNADSPETDPIHSKRRKLGDADCSTSGFQENTPVALQDRTRRPIDEFQTHQFPKEYQGRQPLSEELKQQLLESLKFDQIDERKNTIKRAHTRTCKWLLKSKSYLDWLDPAKIQDHHGFLWIKGKAGAGKSTLMKFAIEKAFKETKDNLILSFFFNARGSQLEKSTVGAYRSLLLKLLIAFPVLQDVFGTLYTPSSSFDTNRDWNAESLKTLLEEVIQRLENVSVICFIDALDECDEAEIRDMFRFFEHIGDLSIEKGIRFLICFSSRHYPHITIGNGIELVLEGNEGHHQDIASYIEAELKIGKSKRAQKIRDAVQDKAAGVFMWVVLVVGILNKESDRGRVDRLQQKLREIPGDLHNLFHDILTRDSHNKEELVLCIQWVLFAKEALTPKQLHHAILLGVDPDAVTAWDPEEIDEDTIRRFILDCSKGLIEITASRSQKVQFIHESVRDFLLKEEGLSKIWPEYKEYFVGQGHERLKQCCLEHLQVHWQWSWDLTEHFQKAISDEARKSCLPLELQYPLLRYTVHNLFYHSDLAEGNGIPQAQFLNNFEQRQLDWIPLHNMFEKFDVRKYKANVGLLYVLAELDCANLIRSHFPPEDRVKRARGRYGYPLLAACALGNNAAIQALSSIFAPASAERDSDIDQGQYGTMNTIAQKSRRNFRYSSIDSLLLNVAHVGPEWLVNRLLGSQKCISNTSSFQFPFVLKTVSERGFKTAAERVLRDHTYLSHMAKDTSLNLATVKGHESVVKILVHKGANIQPQKEKQNCVHIATKRGFEDIAMFLLDHRPDLLDSKNTDNETPLFIAVHSRHSSLARRLILRGADVNSIAGSMGSIVGLAARNGLKDILLLLLDRGAEINVQAHSPYDNPLMAACMRDQLDIVELLLERGASVDMQNEKHGSILQSACSHARKDIVERLLKEGADVNAQGGDYGNALQAACRRGNKDVVELLLKNGADVNARGGLSDHALNATPDPDILELLRSYGAKLDP